jgi:hypothetical protein
MDVRVTKSKNQRSLFSYYCTYNLMPLFLKNELIGFVSFFLIYIIYGVSKPPLRSSGQSSWLQIQRSRVRFPTLPDFFEK